MNVKLHAAGPGSYSVYVWDRQAGRTKPQAGELAHTVLTVSGGGSYRIEVPLRKAPPPQAEVAVAFSTHSGANDSSSSTTISRG